MFKKLRSMKRKTPQRGQALAEFALTAPVLVLLLLGLIDFGAILFSYAQASNSLREALRYAEILGFTGDPTNIPYLDCNGMRNAAENNFFTADHTVVIGYRKSNDPGNTRACDPATKDETNDWLANGDLLEIELTASVDPFFIPIDKLNLEFSGQRTIVKALPITIEGGFGAGGDPGGGDPGGGDPGGGDPGIVDVDGDGVDDSVDNCLGSSNPGQEDADTDGVGDACDNCPAVSNTDQADADGGGLGDACDNCPFDTPEDQTDDDGDLIGNICDADNDDFDSDGVFNVDDNCPNNFNPGQEDVDVDGVGDICDNCPDDYNPTQADADGINGGDVCDDSGVSPPAPVNFTAYLSGGDCSSGLVSFGWVPMSPWPTRMEIIYNQNDADFTNDVVVEDMDDVPPSLVSNSFCLDCDTIDPVNGYKCYYAVAYNGTAPEYQGPPSNVSCVDCLATPLTPISFTATCDAASGDVDFGWDYSSVAPTTVTIESTDGAFSTTLPGADKSCDACDAPAGSRTYHIYATNGVPPGSKDSANSANVTVDCPTPPNGEIVGSLFKAQNSSQTCTQNGVHDATGATVKLLSYPGAAEISNITISGSTFTFTDLPPGDYYVDLPAVASGRSKVSDTSSGVCADSAATRVTLTVNPGSTTNVSVGYY